MLETYMQFQPQPTAITLGYHVIAERPVKHCEADHFRPCDVRIVTGTLRKESRTELFDLRENVFHLFPAEGAQRMTFDVAE